MLLPLGRTVKGGKKEKRKGGKMNAEDWKLYGKAIRFAKLLREITIFRLQKGNEDA